jgi:hypothetical protein
MGLGMSVIRKQNVTASQNMDANALFVDLSLKKFMVKMVLALLMCIS